MNTDSLRTSLSRYGFTNPIALAYELVPYSFVLDWWINLGDVLASLDNLTLVKELYVRDSTRTTISKQCVAANAYVSGSWKEIQIVDARSAPQPISRINTLEYKPSVSKLHILNGLALLRTARRDVT